MTSTVPSTSTIGSRRRAAANASPARVCAFSRTSSSSRAACQVARSTTGGRPDPVAVVHSACSSWCPPRSSLDLGDVVASRPHLSDRRVGRNASVLTRLPCEGVAARRSTGLPRLTTCCSGIPGTRSCRSTPMDRCCRSAAWVQVSGLTHATKPTTAIRSSDRRRMSVRHGGHETRRGIDRRPTRLRSTKPKPSMWKESTNTCKDQRHVVPIHAPLAPSRPPTRRTRTRRGLDRHSARRARSRRQDQGW